MYNKKRKKKAEKNANHPSESGPLQLLFPLSGTLHPQTATGCTPSCSSGIYAHAIHSVRTSLTILFKIITPVPSLTLSIPLPLLQFSPLKLLPYDIYIYLFVCSFSCLLSVQNKPYKDKNFVFSAVIITTPKMLAT